MTQLIFQAPKMPQRPLQVNAYEERLRNTQKPHEGGIAIRGKTPWFSNSLEAVASTKKRWIWDTQRYVKEKGNF